MQQHVENHSDEHRLAVRTLVGCTACAYQMPRGSLTCPRCGQPGPGARTTHSARKRRDISKCILGTLMMIIGGLFFFQFIPYPINLVLAPTVLILGAATASSWQCGRCGAQVDRQAMECPRCSLPFTPV